MTIKLMNGKLLLAAACLLLLAIAGHAQQTNNIVGIGVSLAPQDGYLVVNNVIKGGPAELSGQIHPQDKIQGIGQGRNGKIEDITGMPLADATALIRGVKGTVVRLNVLSGGNGPLKTVELVRDEIKIEPTAEQRQQQIAYQIRTLQSPRQRLRAESDFLNTDRSGWNGHGSWQPLNILLRNGADAELGLTDDQKQQLSALYADGSLSAEWHQQMRENPTLEYTQTLEALEATRIPDDPLFERATEEQKDAFREAQLAQLTLFTTDMQTLIEEVLTPEQMLQVRKLEMQLMPELGIPFPSMFDPLDLTEEQKKEMQEITDELKGEFDALTMELAAIKAERVISAYGTLTGKSFASLDELSKARGDAFRQYVPSDEMRKRVADLQERGKKLVATLQNRLMDVLTDEQLVKMQEILDGTPEFAKRIIARLKAQRETEEKSPTYIPGPGAWQPGSSAIPEQYRQERNSRFPRGGN